MSDGTTDDLILANARLLTQDDARPVASAAVVRGGRFAYVGDEAGAVASASPGARRVDLGGRTAVPGFCDAHLHLVWFGMTLLRQVDLVGSGSVGEVVERLRALPAGETGWVQGHGFDQDKLAERRMPTRADLDAAFPQTPVVISRVCGHAAVVNSAALARVSDEARAAGDAENGLYTEGDVGPFFRAVPTPGEGEYERAVLAACDVALRAGVTSVHTLLESADQMGAFQRLHRRGELPIRVTAIPPWSAVDALHAHGVGTGFGDERLRFGPCKLFSDGSFGARTAWVEQPYADDPATRGLRIYDPDDLRAKCVHAAERGWSLAIHAIGDAALRETLDGLDAALDATGGDNGFWRHRVEHASLCPPDQLKRLADRGIVVTLQPQFVTSDTWTGGRLGPARSRWAYPFRDLLDAGVPVALSSDCPVERLDSAACLSSAVGRAAWSPEGGLTAGEAVRVYTLGGAHAAGCETWAGSIAPGKVADLAVLSADPTGLDAAGLASLRAERVFVEGVERTQ